MEAVVVERLNVEGLVVVVEGGSWKGAKAAIGRGCGFERYSWGNSLGHG